MKRSTIEQAIATARRAFERCGLRLPPFAAWNAAEWASRAETHAARAGYGWDVTDYGRGDFDAFGLTLFTVRNGLISELEAGRGFAYAEKAMFVRDGQYNPMHRHRLKVEDIIVRGGPGRLALELWPNVEDGGDGRPARGERVRVLCDGVPRETGPDGQITLGPGESVTLTPEIWHAFWAEGGDVVVGEVSSVNDDATDNIFEEPLPRFPAIEEDAPATVPLVGERLAA